MGAAAIALILVVALLLGALEALHLHGAGTSQGSGTSPASGMPSSFYGALPAATAFARALYWDWPPNGQPPLVFAEGLVSPAALGPIANTSHLGVTACSPTLLSTAVATLPAYTGGASAGIAPGWLFAFSPLAMQLVILAVVDGNASLVATTSSDGACYNGPGPFNTVVVDSSVAAGAAAGTALSRTFLAGASANATPVDAEFLLIPPGTVTGTPLDPVWLVNDTTCELYGTGPASGTTLASAVNAATGALLSQSETTGAC